MITAKTTTPQADRFRDSRVHLKNDLATTWGNQGTHCTMRRQSEARKETRMVERTARNFIFVEKFKFYLRTFVNVVSWRSDLMKSENSYFWVARRLHWRLEVEQRGRGFLPELSVKCGLDNCDDNNDDNDKNYWWQRPPDCGRVDWGDVWGEEVGVRRGVVRVRRARPSQGIQRRHHRRDHHQGWRRRELDLSCSSSPALVGLPPVVAHLWDEQLK